MGKIIIYQAFCRYFSLRRGLNRQGGSIEQNLCGKFSSFNDNFFSHIKSLGVTHLWLTGIIEHASQTPYPEFEIYGDAPSIVKGVAGSPYAIRDYYALSPDFADDIGNIDSEFSLLLEHIHSNDIKAIIDFVPNHVSRVYHSRKKPLGTIDLGENDDKNTAFSPQNNFYYIPDEKFCSPCGEFDEYPAKVTGNDCFSSAPNINDWYETVKLNYGVDYLSDRQKHFSVMPQTWLQMLQVLMYWAERGVDGFRCDMAEMVPVEFWHFAISRVKERFPNVVFIAEIYNPMVYRSYLEYGGFDFLYDKVGLYDTLRAVVVSNLPAKEISHCWQLLGDIQPNMLNFLENHDEQRIASDFFALNPRLALPAVVVSAFMNTNPFMIYAGQEFGEKGMDSEGFSGIDGRSSIFDYWQPEAFTRWIDGGKYGEDKLSLGERSLLSEYRRILSIATNNSAISEGVFFDLTYANIENPQFNSERCFAFFRKYEKRTLLVVANFSEQPQRLEVIIPYHAFEFLSLEPKECVAAIDLLECKRYCFDFKPSTPVCISLECLQSIVLEFC